MGRGSVKRHSQHSPESRRTFNRLLVGLVAAASRIAIAQSPTVIRRIGRLEAGAPDTPEDMWEQAAPLRDLGWREGRNLQVERRYANGRLEVLQSLAEELLRAKVEIIVTGGAEPTRAAMRATTTIPIIFRAASDPVLNGLVASLARPGGNVTGFSVVAPEAQGKMLSLFKELVPELRRIGVLEVSGNPQFRLFRPQFEQACRLLALEPVFVEVAIAGEIEGAIAQLAPPRAEALVLRPDSLINEHMVQIASAALRHGLPTMASDAQFVREAGILASYGSTVAEGERRTASFVDRVLRGAKPADLPVEQPTQFKIAINLKTARALRLSVPKSMLLRADELIR